MAYKDRIELYKKIETSRGRPLIVFVTSSRQNATGAIASDVIPELTKQLLRQSKDSTAIDLLVVSQGGDPTVSWHIISMLREKYKKIGVLLPFTAYSAATLLALGADEIVMHPFSNLGPVDPQLISQRRKPAQDGDPGNIENIHFGSEDLMNFLEFVRTEVGISDQEQLEKAFELLCEDVGPLKIGAAKRSTQLSLSMGEKLLSLHMKDTSKAKAIAETLNRSYFHHGYPLGRREAKNIGISVTDPDEDLEDLLWEIWTDIETEMKCNEPFSLLNVVLSDEKTAQLIGPVSQLQIPVNLPAQVQQQVINKLLQQINTVNVDPVDYDLFQATLESKACRSEYRTEGKINATRLPNMKIATSNLMVSQGWKFFPGPTGKGQLSKEET